jgi:hypothetical protein
MLAYFPAAFRRVGSSSRGALTPGGRERFRIRKCLDSPAGSPAGAWKTDVFLRASPGGRGKTRQCRGIRGECAGRGKSPDRIRKEKFVRLFSPVGFERKNLGDPSLPADSKRKVSEDFLPTILSLESGVETSSVSPDCDRIVLGHRSLPADSGGKFRETQVFPGDSDARFFKT